jgi:hypothetical protein
VFAFLDDVLAGPVLLLPLGDQPIERLALLIREAGNCSIFMSQGFAMLGLLPCWMPTFAQVNAQEWNSTVLLVDSVQSRSMLLAARL